MPNIKGESKSARKQKRKAFDLAFLYDNEN